MPESPNARANGAAQYEIGLDLDFDATATDQKLGLSRIRGGHVGLKAMPVEPIRCLPDTFADLRQSLVAWQLVVTENKVKIHGQARHVAYEEVDRRAAFQRKGIVDEYQRRNLRKQARRFEVDRLHGLRTRRPSADWDTQGRWLPIGRSFGSSWVTHGREPSRPSCRHSRTVLTLLQCCSSSRSTSARRV